MQAQARRQGERDAGFQPVARFFDAVALKAGDQTLTLEGRADLDVLQALFDASGLARMLGLPRPRRP